MSARSSRIKEVFNLKQIYFASINDIIKNNSNIESSNVMPMALERWQNKLFLVTPRLKVEVPVTLSYINITSKHINKMSSKILFYIHKHFIYFILI